MERDVVNLRELRVQDDLIVVLDVLDDTEAVEVVVRVLARAIAGGILARAAAGAVSIRVV